MSSEVACQAIELRRCLELRYKGYTRVVEVHAVGVSTGGQAIMRVWQVRGGSESGETSGWKLMHLNEARELRLLEEPSRAPRQGYKRNDSAMTRIYCQI